MLGRVCTLLWSLAVKPSTGCGVHATYENQAWNYSYGKKYLLIMFLIEKWKDEKLIFPTSQITYLGVLDSKPEKLSAWQIKFRTLLVLAYRTPNLEGFYTANVLFLYFHIPFVFILMTTQTPVRPRPQERKVHHQRLCTLNKGSRHDKVPHCPSSIFTREMRRKSLVRIRHSGCRGLFSWRRPSSARSIPLDSWRRRRRFLTCCCSCPRGPRLAEAAPGASRRRSARQGGSAATQKQRNAISGPVGEWGLEKEKWCTLGRTHDEEETW